MYCFLSWYWIKHQQKNKEEYLLIYQFSQSINQFIGRQVIDHDCGDPDHDGDDEWWCFNPGEN